MLPCNHEEADTRIIIHLLDALEHGYSTCLVRTVDTDVVDISLAVPCPAREVLTADIWVAFGTGNNYSCVHINAICHSLVSETSTALPIFHCYTGCDTISVFCGKGKKSAWDAWSSYRGHSGLQLHGSKWALSLDNRWPHFKLLERYTVVIYDKTSHSGSINEARRELFCQKNKTMEHIQPTQDSLLQHAKRVAYQSGIWATCELAHQPTPSPEGCGWTLDGDSHVRRPVWSTLSMVSKACLQLGKCDCCRSASGCGGRSVCKKTLEMHRAWQL